MAYLVALALLALVATIATVWLIRTDGHGRIPTDPRRLPGGTDLVATPEPAASTPTESAPASPARRGSSSPATGRPGIV